MQDLGDGQPSPFFVVIYANGVDTRYNLVFIPNAVGGALKSKYIIYFVLTPNESVPLTSRVIETVLGADYENDL